MDTNTLVLVQAIGIFLALFGFWWRLSGEMKKLSDDIKNLDTKLSGEIKSLDTKLSGEIKSLDTKLSGEIKEVRLASEAAHKEINEKLNAIEVTQARHSERFNTVNERFNKVDEQFKTVKAQVKSLDDKADRLREAK